MSSTVFSPPHLLKDPKNGRDTILRTPQLFENSRGHRGEMLCPGCKLAPSCLHTHNRGKLRSGHASIRTPKPSHQFTPISSHGRLGWINLIWVPLVPPFLFENPPNHLSIYLTIILHFLISRTKEPTLIAGGNWVKFHARTNVLVSTIDLIRWNCPAWYQLTCNRNTIHLQLICPFKTSLARKTS